jgi:hypothetical protein
MDLLLFPLEFMEMMTGWSGGELIAMRGEAKLQKTARRPIPLRPTSTHSVADASLTCICLYSLLSRYITLWFMPRLQINVDVSPLQAFVFNEFISELY